MVSVKQQCQCVLPFKGEKTDLAGNGDCIRNGQLAASHAQQRQR